MLFHKYHTWTLLASESLRRGQLDVSACAPGRTQKNQVCLNRRGKSNHPENPHQWPGSPKGNRSSGGCGPGWRRPQTMCPVKEPPKALCFPSVPLIYLEVSPKPVCRGLQTQDHHWNNGSLNRFFQWWDCYFTRNQKSFAVTMQFSIVGNLWWLICQEPCICMAEVFLRDLTFAMVCRLLSIPMAIFPNFTRFLLSWLSSFTLHS